MRTPYIYIKNATATGKLKKKEEEKSCPGKSVNMYYMYNVYQR